MIEGLDYFIDKNGQFVFTALYLFKRGKCCGNKCINCVYVPLHTKGSVVVKDSLVFEE